ncbi:MAG: sigma-70 family RNA polymerase sigma factor [Planctomycetia bacterium]|nr:sigma-70 family RNA polymerase sigma factor [Planctomycetia bacterium]
MKDEQTQKLREKATFHFLQHHDFIRRVAFRAAPNPSLQEDIVQDVYVEFVSKAGKWDYDSELRPLLRKITTNIAKRYWHEKLRHLPSNLQKIAALTQKYLENERPAHEARFDDQQLALDLCMKKLTSRSLLILEAFYCKQMKAGQIAAMVGMTEGAVHKVLSRAREFLRQCVDKSVEGTQNDI